MKRLFKAVRRELRAHRAGTWNLLVSGGNTGDRVNWQSPVYDRPENRWELRRIVAAAVKTI